MIKFRCELIKKYSRKKEHWNGQISNWEDYGSHYELKINSRSKILVILGQTSYGNFACMPDFGVGCHLTEFDNIFYNTEKLCEVVRNRRKITVSTQRY